MNDFTNLFMIICLFFCIILLFMWNEYYLEAKTMSEYLETQTVFHNKDNNKITCVISSISWNDYFNPRMELDVTYPSGSKIKLLTTFEEFKRIWI